MLGSPARLRILLCCLDRPQSARNVALDLDLSRSLVSQHFRVLRAARLVTGVRAGKRGSLRLADGHVRTFLEDMLMLTSKALPR
ncbi:winged helix-turn-helix domain-containing protein [Devosia sp.]|uniref:ArsR/SmtB family transcription factor n=1 Tax=Devosia sp. TaxID=1871048 RepID=UPI0025C6037F|nr:winged helix-turn-helix domain-containing protein [Devosia sp.]